MTSQRKTHVGWGPSGESKWRSFQVKGTSKVEIRKHETFYISEEEVLPTASSLPPPEITRTSGNQSKQQAEPIGFFIENNQTKWIAWPEPETQVSRLLFGAMELRGKQRKGSIEWKDISAQRGAAQGNCVTPKQEGEKEWWLPRTQR